MAKADPSRVGSAGRPGRSLDQWKSPTRGYPGRDPDVVLYLSAELGQTPTPGRLRPWVTLGELMGLLGDHRVEVTSHAESKLLFRTDLSWRSIPYATQLRTTLSWLTRGESWGSLGVLFSGPWSIRAHRGGGAARHRVWELRGSPLYPPGPARLELEMKGRHIADDQLSALPSLIEAFYRGVSAAGGEYGSGGFVPEVLHRSPRYYGGTVFGDLWERGPRSRANLVPWVYPVNFLDAARVRAADGLSPGPLRKALKDLRIIDIDGGALVLAWRLRRWMLEPRGDGFDPDREMSVEELWLLSRLSRAGMLAVQHLDWVEKRVGEGHEAELESLRLYRESRKGRERRRGSGDRLAGLKHRAPRCIAKVGVPVADPLRGKLAAEIHGSTTHFTIRPSGEDRALTVYGRGLRGTEGVGSPVRAGSLKPERAVMAFDAVRDGHDGEIGGREVRPATARMRQFCCPRCDGRVFHLRAVFEYPDDFDDLDEAQRRHAEDYFTWFWLIGRCPACAWEGLVADVECA